MATIEEKRDKHFSLFAHDNSFRRLFSSSNKYCSYVTKGQAVVDLGCGPGYYTIALAECVGPEGKVYAVDSDEKAIQALEKKADKHGCHNIEAHASSAADLSFIRDRSVDFVLDNGLLCSMTPQQHESAVNEMKRILEPSGQAYLSVAKGSMSYVGQAEWEKILEGFRVERRSDLSWRIDGLLCPQSSRKLSARSTCLDLLPTSTPRKRNLCILQIFYRLLKSTIEVCEEDIAFGRIKRATFQTRWCARAQSSSRP